jgi:hypothetical protein
MVASFPIWLSPWSWTSADWAGLTFAVLALTALVALRQVKEAQRLREEQARPFVIIDFDVWSTIIELVIKNIGSTLANDIKFEVDPPFITTDDDLQGRGSLTELNLFKNGIPSLPPEKEITTYFDQFPARLEAGLPLTYDVCVSYSSPSGKTYSERSVLDLAMYVGTGGVTRHDLHDVHNQLEKIAKTLDELSKRQARA